MFDNKTNKEEHAAEYKIINCKNVMYKQWTIENERVKNVPYESTVNIRN